MCSPCTAASSATCSARSRLDLLGLDVDLYGKTKANPVIVTINAIPSQGLLGQLLCGLAGGTGVTSLG